MNEWGPAGVIIAGMTLLGAVFRSWLVGQFAQLRLDVNAETRKIVEPLAERVEDHGIHLAAMGYPPLPRRRPRVSSGD